MVELTGLLALALVAFAGGAFGASLGGLSAYGIAGFLVIVGETANISGATGELAGVGLLGSSGLTGTLGLGPAFGPHVAFAGAVAAAAFAARRRELNTDTQGDYHPAKRIDRALGGRGPTLVVGGAFGIVGVLLAGMSNGGFGPTAGSLPWAGLPWDPISFAIVVSALLHRIVFGYPLVGSLGTGLLDMSPYTRGDRREPRSTGVRDEAGSEEEAAVPRYVVEPWLPHQSAWGSVALLGGVVGVFAAFVTYVTGSVFLAFGFAATTLLLPALGLERAPITHHMALPASIVIVGLVGVSDPSLIDATPYVAPADIAGAVTMPLALLAGAGTGVVSGLFGELAQRALYAHADTHLDPPAVAILLSTLLIAALDIAGIFTQNVVPTVGA